MGPDIKVSGINLVQDVFLNLPAAMRKKTLKPSMRSAMQVLKKAAQKNIKAATSGTSTGTLGKSLRVYNLRPRHGAMRAGVMIKKGSTYPNKTYKGEPLRVGMVGAILEYGKENQAPRSWLVEAAFQTKSAVLVELKNQISKRLSKAITAAKSR